MARKKLFTELFQKMSREIWVDFLRCLRCLASPPPISSAPYTVGSSHRIELLNSLYDRTNISVYWVRSLIREYLRDSDDINFQNSECVCTAYLSRCLGHHVSENLFLQAPHIAVLYSRNVIKGRWREAEGVLARDSEASYFYNQFIMKGRGLPWKMHQELVMRSFLARDYAMEKYFSDQTLQHKIFC